MVREYLLEEEKEIDNKQEFGKKEATELSTED